MDSSGLDTAGLPPLEPPMYASESLHGEINDLKYAVQVAVEESRIASTCSQRMEHNFMQAFGGDTPSHWAEQFIEFILEKVKEEIHQQVAELAVACIDTTVSSPLPLPATVSPPPTVIEHSSELLPAVTAASYSPVEPVGGGDGRGKLFVLAEALRTRCSALEQRQATVESKVNALVSDLVFSTQTIRNDMNVFADKMHRQMSLLGEEVRDLLRRHTPDVATDATVAATVVARNLTGADARGSLSVPASSISGEPPAGTITEYASSNALVDQRMFEMVSVLNLLKNRIEEDHEEFAEWQAASFDMTSRIAARVTSMAGESTRLKCELDSMRADTDALTVNLVDEMKTNSELVHVLAHEVREQEQRLTKAEDALVVNRRSAKEAIKDCARSAAEDLKVLEARVVRVEEAAHHIAAATQHILQTSETDENGCLRSNRHSNTTASLQIVHQRLGEFVEHRESSMLLSRHFKTWWSWWKGRERLRQDNIILGLFQKQDGRMDAIQRRLDQALMPSSVNPAPPFFNENGKP